MDAWVGMGYVIAALGLVVVVQGAALFALVAARRRACRRGDLGAVAHDLNNVLAVVLNYSSFLHDDLPEGDPRRQDIAEIRRAARRAGGLSHELLELTRDDRARVQRPRYLSAVLRQTPRKRRAAA
jgi:signal transduction histidine kinase